MCGITGIISDIPFPGNKENVKHLLSTLSHRGPDSQRIWDSPDRDCTLGHARLAILDLSESGAQPMHSPCGRYTVVFNGEIYNFLELREELAGVGCEFVGTSDTEVLLQAFIRWGEKCLKKFNGMFAFAIWDRRERKLFLARDRFGIKPLHYAIHGGRLIFSSELKAYRALPGFPLAMDPEMRERVLIDPFSVESTGKTLLAGVCQLPAGHCATYRQGRLSLRRWWNLAEALPTVPESFSDQVESWKDLFFSSLKLRLRSDVPVGTALSGGFDSSAILCSLAKLIRDGQGGTYANALHEAFVASFPGADNDETHEAQLVLQHAGVPGHFFDIASEDPTDTIDEVLHQFEGIYLHLPTPVGRIYQEQRRHGTVVSLDGHGCDEMMGAYRGERTSVLRDAPSFLLHPLENFQRIAEHLRLARRDLDLPGRTFYSESARQIFTHLPSLQWLRNVRQAFGIQPAFFRNRTRLPKFPSDPAWKGAPDVERMFHQMFHQTILPTLLRNFDRMSMAHGVEVRMPFLDWRLVALTFSLPTSSKIHDGQSKFVGRMAMDGVLPDEIRLSRRKVGFASPTGRWMNGNLGYWAESVVQSCGASHDLLDIARLRAEMTLRNREKSWSSDSRTLRIWLYVNFLWFEGNFASPLAPVSSTP